MATNPQQFNRDANRVPIVGLGLLATPKAITYSALTTGATGATTLFTVAGVVSVRIFAVCSASLTGSGTIEVGISGNTAALIAQSTGTNIDSGHIWIDASPASVQGLPSEMILSATDIIQTIATDTLTGGTLTYYCLFTPISSDGNVTVA